MVLFFLFLIMSTVDVDVAHFMGGATTTTTMTCTNTAATAATTMTYTATVIHVPSFCIHAKMLKKYI